MKMEDSKLFDVKIRVSNLYKFSTWHDIEFLVQDDNTGQTVVLRAHRVILATCSPVFEALCFGPMAEKGPINVTDIDANAFDVMLQFLYTDDAPINSVEVGLHLLYAAKKYMVPTLGVIAAKYVSEEISDRHCIDILNVANMLEKKDLTRSAFEHITRRFPYIEQYLRPDNISTELVINLVTCEMVNCDERTLVNLAQMWAKHACETMGLEVSGTNIRNLLLQYNIFQNIRWGVLNEEDWSNVIPGLFTEKEISLFLSNLGHQPFRERCPMKEAWIYRFDAHFSKRRPVRDGITIISRVTVNMSVTLAVLVITAKGDPIFSKTLQTYQERMEMTIKNDKEVLLQQSIRRDVAFGTSFRVKLNKNVEMSEKNPYDISLQLLNPVKDYNFNNFCKLPKNPLGISVDCVELADLQSPGVFESAPNFGLISAFGFLH